MARHVVSVLSILHRHQAVHGELDPHMVDVVERDSVRVALRVLRLPSCPSRPKEFRAPELEENANGQAGASLSDLCAATAAADMFAFGVLLFWMNFPDAPLPVAGAPLRLPPDVDHNLRHLVLMLLDVKPETRPSAADVLLHPYFTASFSDRLVASGEILRQDDKLEAVRALIRQVRKEHRLQSESIKVRREPTSLVEDVLSHFKDKGGTRHGARAPLKVQFVGEAGQDEGGLTAEMFSLFFEELVSPHVGLFECASDFSSDSAAADDQTNSGKLYLPKSGDLDCTGGAGSSYMAVGRAIVKCFYEGKRIGSRFAPSFYKFLAHGADSLKQDVNLELRSLDDLKRYDPPLGASLEWLLNSSNSEHLGMDFEDIPTQPPKPVNDTNKSQFVRLKILHTLVECRQAQLEAVRHGFWKSLVDLSPEAAPFLRLLSPTDWSVLLCGEENLTGEAVVAVLEFNGYSKQSRIPRWLSQAVLQFSPDNLRRFLIFCTGAPSLPPRSTKVQITVQYQRASEALPVAHTCFFKLDLPDYPDQETFVGKLMKAIQECASFDRV